MDPLEDVDLQSLGGIGRGIEREFASVATPTGKNISVANDENENTHRKAGDYVC
jgi:hypothetical protein